jgi:hypothetical protein
MYDDTVDGENKDISWRQCVTIGFQLGKYRKAEFKKFDCKESYSDLCSLQSQI